MIIIILTQFLKVYKARTDELSWSRPKKSLRSVSKRVDAIPYGPCMHLLIKASSPLLLTSGLLKSVTNKSCLVPRGSAWQLYAGCVAGA